MEQFSALSLDINKNITKKSNNITEYSSLLKMQDTKYLVFYRLSISTLHLFSNIPSVIENL